MSSVIRLRPGLHYAPVQQGVYFGAARTRFVLRGPAALFRAADVCVPLLEDGASEDGLVSALGTERARPVVRRLLDTFDEHGLLLRPDRLTVPPPPARERERHAAALAHLETVSDDPYRDFARLRAAKVLLCGPAASVAPAARGLAEAGVGRFEFAVPGPEAATEVAALARRLDARVRVLPDAARTPADLDARADLADLADVDAVLLCRSSAAPESWTEWREQSPEGPEGVPLVPLVPVVPVAATEHFALVGPVLDGPAATASRAALEERVRAWAAAESVPRLVRPTGDALAGAIGGRAVFHALTTGTPPGEAYLVHGDDLTAERLTAAQGAAEPPPVEYALPAGHAPHLEQPGGAEETAAAVESLAARWTGRYALVTPYDLEQLPVALAEAAPRAGAPSGAGRAPGGSVVRWGRDQSAASLHTALELLRTHCPLPAGDHAVPAAGLTRDRWLLDGCLRLLVPHAEPRPAHPAHPAPAYDGLDDAARGLWRVLEDYEDVHVGVELRHVPGLDWPLASVQDPDGRTLARAFGPDAGAALHDALAGAVARVRTRAARDGDPTGDGVSTQALNTADSAAVALLAEQVTHAAQGLGLDFTGRALRTDPVLGTLPFWHGVVSAAPRARAAASRRCEERMGEQIGERMGEQMGEHI